MTTELIEDLYPLTPTQQGMLFHTLYTPDAGIYIEQMTCTLEGTLDQGAFERAWARVIDRHAVLRSAFDWESMDQSTQVVMREVDLPLRLHDWRDLEPEARQQRLDAHLADERERGFDLAVAPLVRITLFRLADQTYQMTWCHHHIILDGWSMPILVNELFRCYWAERAGLDLELPRPRPFRDYIAWLQRQDLSAAEVYWRRRLAGFPAPTPLGVESPGPDAELPRELFGDVRSRLSAVTSSTLSSLAQSQHLTLSAIALGAWALLLSRRSEEPDVVLGALVSGRPAELSGAETMVGLFLNTLPLRAQVRPEQGFLAFAREVHETLLELRTHEHSPLVQVQGWSEIPRGTSLFESMVSYESFPLGSPSPAGEQELVVREPKIVGSPHYPLNLAFNPGEIIELGLRYDTRRFRPEAVRELLDQYVLLLEQVAATPTIPLARLSLVTPAARRILPDPAVVLDRPEPLSLPERFHEVAAHHSQRPAVVQGGEIWTYVQLAERANALAALLAEAGVEAGTAVAVSGERSPGLVSSMLAVLLAGGVLVPLDPRLPTERRREMERQAGVRHRLEDSSGPEPTDEEEIRLWRFQASTGLPEGAVPGAEPPQRSTRPGDPAYVFFTSGTTGRPKGVLGCHRGLAHFLDWQRTTFEVGPGDRSAQLTGLSFDVVLRDLFLPLTAGATLCLPEPGLDVASPDLPAWLETQGITLLHTVPSLARHWLLTATKGASLGALRHTFFAGEPLTEELVSAWRSTFAAGGEVINLYGPTETTLAKLSFRVPDPPLPGVQPIGRPLPQTQALVLGEGDRLCGLGEPGEIVLRTPFRTLGYLQPGAVEAARFFPSPWSGDQEDLLYRSGDVGRHRLDGVLEILGRRDEQLKVRGVRIVPGEIESVLREHAGVQDAVVIARPSPRGEAALAAFVVATRDRAARVDGRLRRRLPNHLAVVELGEEDTLGQYAEIFEEKVFTRHGIEVGPRGRVIDLGAGIGLFRLFCQIAWPGCRVDSFEADPAAFSLLSTNASLYPSPGGLHEVTPEELAGGALSRFLDEEALDRVDLLKISRVPNPAGVLEGIREDLRAKLELVVIRLEPGEAAARVLEPLARLGFECTVEDEPSRYLYAWQSKAAGRSAGAEAHGRPLPTSRPLLSGEELMAWLIDRLPPALVPSSISMLDQLPLTPNGKLDQRALPVPQAERPPLRQAYVAPRDAVEMTLVELWEGVLGVRPIGVRDSFFDLGGHSLLVATLVSRIERELARSVPLGTLFHAPTIEKLAQVLGEAGAAPSTPLLPIQPQGSKRPVFFVHPLGGSAVCYLGLARELGLEQPIYGLDTHYLVHRDETFDSLEAMASRYVEAVRQVSPAGPYRLGGWSFGGLVAFEMAQQLTREGEEVELLALLDTFLSSEETGRRSEADSATVLSELLGDRIPLVEEELRRLDGEGQLRYVLDRCREADAVPLGYDEGTARRLMEIVSMNGRLSQAYRPRLYPGQITYYQARMADSPPGGPIVEEWRRLSGQPLAHQVVLGNHREMLSPPYVAGLAETIGSELDRLDTLS
ncbi:MAG TPA: amino acid adenylation domain-containing protein [Thermoanaerobaculia bacterium]|nr:amino acid adenylation domain-containing protein [Thermoanaerobaculia bacterium]